VKSPGVMGIIESSVSTLPDNMKEEWNTINLNGLWKLGKFWNESQSKRRKKVRFGATPQSSALF